MSITTAQPGTTYTPDDLLAMPDGKHYELVDGHLVETNVSALSSQVGVRLSHLISTYCDADNLAWVFGADCGYRCFPGHPNKVRRSDVSVILRDRMTIGQLEVGFSPIPPDLAVEVISPNDLAYEIDEKVDEYLRAGVRLVWVINPQRRTVRVHRADGSVSGLREADELSGEDVLAGFRCRVGDLFPAPAATPTA